MKLIKAEEQPTNIYGLFDFRGRCIYVGQTVNMVTRRRLHRKTKKFQLMKLIRECLLKDAGRIEYQIINAYKRRGQCNLNKSNHPTCLKHLAKCGFVTLPEYGLTFESKAQAARYLGVTASCLNNWKRDGKIRMLC